MRKKWLAFLGLCFVFVLLASMGGCTHWGYYAQAIAGHLRVVSLARPVSEWLDAPETPAQLKDKLRLSQRIRDFAVHRLHLPDNPSYRRYADLGQSSVVWNVVAAPPLSLRLQTWCFVLAGCISYRGYYSQEQAQAYAHQLRSQGLEVVVYGVRAYSTLGRLPGAWFSDPLLNTFIHLPEFELARMVFHELAHQVAYAPGDTMFNESFATAVERLGGALWLQEQGSPENVAAAAQFDARQKDFYNLTNHYRERLENIYSGLDGNEQEKLLAKAWVMAQMRAEHQRLKQAAWGGYPGYDHWFRGANNASMGIVSAYNEWVPAFERIFEENGRDFVLFYDEVRRLAALPQEQRKAHLRTLHNPSVHNNARHTHSAAP